MEHSRALTGVLLAMLQAGWQGKLLQNLQVPEFNLHQNLAHRIEQAEQKFCHPNAAVALDQPSQSAWSRIENEWAQVHNMKGAYTTRSVVLATKCSGNCEQQLCADLGSHKFTCPRSNPLYDTHCASVCLQNCKPC